MLPRTGWMFSIVLLVALTGCGEGGGPTRYRLSGAAMLDGMPIAYGEVIITPDSTKKNIGPQGKAMIKDGRYDTATPGGMGISGGAVIIRINGLTAPGGKTLCEYEMAFDLPNGESTKDFNIPAKDAHNANPKPAGGKAPAEI